MRKNIKKIKYTVAHRKTFRKVARQYGLFSARHYLHDLDKIIYLCFMRPDAASRLHRDRVRHHNPVTYDDIIEMVIDWECARFTKPDKPLSARETLEVYQEGELMSHSNIEMADNIIKYFIEDEREDVL